MTRQPLQRINHLRDCFYTAPGTVTANQTMTLREWQETALYTGGWILACGNTWDLVAKRVAPGVYNVTTKQREYS